SRRRLSKTGKTTGRHRTTIDPRTITAKSLKPQRGTKGTRKRTEGGQRKCAGLFCLLRVFCSEPFRHDTSITGHHHSRFRGGLSHLGFNLPRDSLRDRNAAAVFDGRDPFSQRGRDPFYVGQSKR